MCFSIGVIVIYNIPTKWNSSAIIAPATEAQLQSLSELRSKLSMLNIGLDIMPNKILSDFLVIFDTPDVFYKYIATLPKSNEVKINQFKISKRESKNGLDNYKDNYILSSIANSSAESRNNLKEYINFVNSINRERILNNIRYSISESQRDLQGKINFSKKQMDISRDIEIQRLKNAILVATAAGITKPIDSGMEKKNEDSIDYSILVGTDALKRQLEIVKSTDFSKTDEDILTQEFFYSKIGAINISNVSIPSFNYLQSPSITGRENIKFKLFLVVLFTFFGFVSSVFFVLIRHYVHECKVSTK